MFASYYSTLVYGCRACTLLVFVKDTFFYFMVCVSLNLSLAFMTQCSSSTRLQMFIVE